MKRQSKPRCKFVHPVTKIRCPKRAGGLGVCHLHSEVGLANFRAQAAQFWTTELWQGFRNLSWYQRLFISKTIPKKVLEHLNTGD